MFSKEKMINKDGLKRENLQLIQNNKLWELALSKVRKLYFLPKLECIYGFIETTVFPNLRVFYNASCDDGIYIILQLFICIYILF